MDSPLVPFTTSFITFGNIHRRHGDLALKMISPTSSQGSWCLTDKNARCERPCPRASVSDRTPGILLRSAGAQDALNAAFKNLPLDATRSQMEHARTDSDVRRRAAALRHASRPSLSRGHEERADRAWREAADWYQRGLADSWPDFVEPQSAFEAMCSDLELVEERSCRPHVSRCVRADAARSWHAQTNATVPWVQRHSRRHRRYGPRADQRGRRPTVRPSGLPRQFIQVEID